MPRRIKIELITDHSLACILTLLSFLLIGWAQTSPIQIRIDATPKVASVGDPIRIDLDLFMPAGYQAEILKPEKQSGDFFISEFTGPALSDSGKDQKAAGQATSDDRVLVHHRARIVAAVYRTGSFDFPPVQIRLRTPEGKVIEAASAPVKIEIKSILADKDRNLRDLKKQAEIPEPVRWWLWGILAALGILGTLGWFFWKRRREHESSIPEAPPQDLLDLAEADLRKLLAGGLPEDSAMKAFYIRLSEIVKRILEVSYGINTAERTTSEIMEGLSAQLSLKREDVGQIESFLLRCDIVKFAEYIPSKTKHEDAGKDALQILKKGRESIASRHLPVTPGLAAVPPDVA